MLPRSREALLSPNSTRAAAQNVAAEFAWSPSRNSKHALFWLKKDKIVWKNSSTLEMKKSIAAAMLNFRARSFQSARVLLTGSSPSLLDLWNYKLDIPSTKLWRQGKNCISYKYKKLDIKSKKLDLQICTCVKKLATSNNVIKFHLDIKKIDELVLK